MYSNASATTRTAMTRLRLTAASGILQDDGVDDVASIAAAVDRFFEQLEKILAQQQARGIAGIVVQVFIQTEDETIRLGLDGLHAVVQRLHLLELHAFLQL